jgi:predicted PurR-regulated permease PerM
VQYDPTIVLDCLRYATVLGICLSRSGLTWLLCTLLQTRIAIMNTVLTAAGMWALAIPGIGLLSLFVFICSFIPIAGVIISTIPVGFVALTEYGFIKLGLVIVMVIMVHFVEAYGLNPAIYSAHLKLHPLLVLSVLVVAEHNLGIWGLLLAVPLTVFALDYCIRYPDSSVTEVGERELEKVMQGGPDASDDDEEPVFPVRRDAPVLGTS